MKVFRAGPWPLVAILTSSFLYLSACGKGGGSGNETTEAPYSGVVDDEDPDFDPSDVTTEAGVLIDTELLGKLVSHFRFAKSMDSEIINFLRYDFATLSSWTEAGRPEDLAKLGKLYGLGEVNAGSLSQWLMDRLTYVFPDEDEPLRFAFIVPGESRVYRLSVDASAGQGVAASNIGGGLYSIYLDQKDMGVGGLLLKFDDAYIPFLSPRTGVMQIGPSFFDTSDSLDTADLGRRGYRTVKSLYRLSVLFHEARHSDGNDAAGTLSFAHINCPADGTVAEEYEGLPACDDESNGAYAIGGQSLKALAGVCDGICSERELSVLQAIQLDVLSRILVEDSEANYGDPAPEPFLSAIDTTNFEIIPE